MKLFAVGPVEMYPETLELGKVQIPYFRNQYFSDIMLELDSNLRKVLNMQDKDKNIILTASGSGAMEATVMNCLSEKDKVLVIVGGSFGKRFEQLCVIHNIPHDTISIPLGITFDRSMLREYDGKGYTALLVNIHETSIGQLYPMDILSEFCKKNNMYFIVDAISSLFADALDFTGSKIDALIFSSQKALALAPGISVVSLSARMVERINPVPKSMYFDFNDYLKNGVRGQTPFTPAIGIIIQMNEMIKSIANEGIAVKVFKTSELAQYFRIKLRDNGFSTPSYPMSNAMTPVLFDKSASVYYNMLIEDYSINVNPCGGTLANRMIRVGHMGNLTKQDYDILIDALCEIRERVK